MASVLCDQSIQSLGPAKRKRRSQHFALPSPSKRLKAASTIATTTPALSSQLPIVDRDGSFRTKKWFDDTNRNAPRTVPFLDNDPPLYVNRQPSSAGNSACAVRSDGSSSKHRALGKPTAPTRSLLAHMESSESNSEDFRSVIDDLTIENKKLRKKLRQYEMLHCSHLQDDKLFEIRVHGLAAHRKRELEHTLRTFASSIDLSPDTSAANPVTTMRAVSASEPSTNPYATAIAGYPSTASMAGSRKPSSASTSCSKPVDSAYASMSAQAGHSQLQPQDKGRFDKSTQAWQTQRNVTSYLHGIPETLMPQHTMAMSERSRSKLLVERLEQIFTGKGAAPRHHTQSYQQQEVSHSAARADQKPSDAQARGRGAVKEGMREARILPNDTCLQVESLSDATPATQQARRNSYEERGLTQCAQGSRTQSPDQRPTRPLDLDLHRAQVPADNMDYIRHLGLSTPTPSANPTADNGWVYLNLLTNMAQLHTLNVTPEFIRHAVAGVSSRLELSPDGRKVRWRGGTEGSKLNSDSDSSSDVDKRSSTAPGSSASKGELSRNLADTTAVQDRQEPNTALPLSAYEPLDDPGLATRRRPVFLEKVNKEADFHYKPLFFHGLPSKDSDGSEDASGSPASSELMENATGLNSGINSGSHGLRETEVKLRKQNAENGPIIFYHKARFCTDLSGDPVCAVIDESAYSRYTQDPIGCNPEELFDPGEGNAEDGSYTMELDLESTTTNRSTLDLDDLESCISSCISSTNLVDVVPIPMEMSGLGGIQSKDNFMVTVQVRHRNKRKEASQASPNPVRCPPNTLSRTFSGADRVRQNLPCSQPVKMQVISEVTVTAKTDLDPSSLPPPSYVCLPFSSSGSEEDEDEDESPTVPYNKVSRSREAIDTFVPQPGKFSAGSSSDETKESSYAPTSADSDDDDDSIDLLAHARILDPNTVAARERDFEDSIILSGGIAVTAEGSSSGPLKSVQTDGSDVDSMSVDEDGRSRMDDSK